MILRGRQIPWHGALFLALSVSMLGCNIAGGSSCGVRVLSSLPNPGNGQKSFYGLTAQVIEEDCGATVANITTVRLVDQHNKPFGTGEGAVFSYYRGKPKISITWKDPYHLVIDCPDCTDCRDCINGQVTLKEVKHNFVEILYSQQRS
ncbi:MAG TPA: hypothetical protein VL346_00245 [Acidobacteriaceae bacterium]|jgi:hypothetical protein|nr:hypothetical protein [Acidobacteriaceae bacterium]